MSQKARPAKFLVCFVFDFEKIPLHCTLLVMFLSGSQKFEILKQRQNDISSTFNICST